MRPSHGSTLTLIGLWLALGALPSVDAATIRVPGDHSTVQAAVNAAAPGDVVEITNSATYTEDLTITTPVTLRGAAGQRPTLAAAHTAERFGHLGITGPDRFGAVVRVPGVGVIEEINERIEAALSE